MYYMLFLMSYIFISNARLKLAKNQVKAKQHPEANYCYFKMILFLYPKIIGDILKHVQKTSTPV